MGLVVDLNRNHKWILRGNMKVEGDKIPILTGESIPYSFKDDRKY